MAADDPKKEPSSHTNDESSSMKYEKAAVQEATNDSCNAENTTEEMELGPSGPALRAEDHAEVVADSCIKIKLEDVDEEEWAVEAQDEEELKSRAFKKDLSEEKNINGDWLVCSEDGSIAFGNKESCLERPTENIHDGPIVCLDTDAQWDNLLVSTDGGSRTLCCAVCGESFVGSKEFLNHQLMHRNQATTQETDADFHKGMGKMKRFQCKDCGKAFFSIGQCLNHQRSHKQASKSVFHQIAHLKKKSFQCPTCGRCYSRASALDAHRHCHEVKLVKSKSIETSDKPQSLINAPDQAESSETNLEQTGEDQQNVYRCICGRTFRTMCGLGTHQRFSRSCSDGQVKVKVKQEKIKHVFECSECDKTFVSTAALTCHQNWHKRKSVCDNQQYNCTECGKNFTSLSFLNKHQRLFHSEELPAKSFLHQVCQLKKKAFECEECGLRFSRMSALQSHQLSHTDVFREMVKRGAERTFQHESNIITGSTLYPKDSEKSQRNSEELIDVNAIDVDYEIIRVTASDYVNSSSGQDPNPDLVLLCESDHEEKDDTGLSLIQTGATTASSLQLSSDDVKIVQIDYEHLNDEALKNDVIMSTSHPPESGMHTCPRCDQSFVKALSLHHHMLWQKDCQKLKLEKHKVNVSHKSRTNQLSAFHSHQQNLSTTKNIFACLQCERRFVSAVYLSKHQKVCCGKRTGVDDDDEDNNVEEQEKMKHFNPTKSLLGPKVHHCIKCGKGFWSLGAFYHHKQNPVQCADVDRTGLESENGHNRRRKKHQVRKLGQRREYPKEKYECEVCRKTYHMLGCFLKHKLSHEAGEQRAVKSFDYQLEQLKKNSYQCPDCGKGFSRAMALQFHMKCHGYEIDLPVTGSADLPPSPKKLQCMSCKASFTCQSLLEDHQKSCLKPEYPQECESTGIEELVPSSQKADDDLVGNADSVKKTKTPSASLKYKCYDCNKSFSVISALNFHKKIHVKGFTEKRLKKLKGKRVEPAKQLKVATLKLENSSTNAPFICPECGRFFSTNSALGTHRRWHKDKKFARFLSRSYKKCSKKSVDGGPYLCNLCGKGFFYLCVLRRHQLLHTPTETQKQVDRKKDSFTCPDCPMSFSSGSLLTAHFTNTHNKLSMTKNVQSEISSNVSSGTPKKCRMVVKQERAKYKCSYCPKSFLNERGLRVHACQKQHKVEIQPSAPHEERPLTCSPCKLLFISDEALQNHKRFCIESVKNLKLSTEEEPTQHFQNIDVTTKYFYKCNKCAKDFHTEEQLDAHKAQSKSRPHTCALCCRGYWTESQLQQHLAWHDEVRRRLPTELRYRLGVSKTLGSSDKLKASPHALQQHQALLQSVEPFHCSLCPQIFSDIKDLIDHHQECLGDTERKCNKLNPPGGDAGNLTCIECGHSFNQEEELHQHYIEHARGEF